MFVVFDHDIEDRHELAHAGDHGDLEGLAGGNEPFPKGSDDRVETHRRDRGHVQAGPDGRPAPRVPWAWSTPCEIGAGRGKRNNVESRGGAVAHDAPFPPPAHRTGRADFPHPALGEGSCFRARQAGGIPFQLAEAEGLFQPGTPIPMRGPLQGLMLGFPPSAEPVPDV